MVSKNRAHPASAPAAGFWRDLADVIAQAIRVVRRGALPLAGLVLVTQVVVAAWAAPGIRWLIGEAMRTAGGAGVDNDHGMLGAPLTAAMLIAACAAAFAIVATQLLVLLVAVRRVRAGERVLSGEAALEFLRIARRAVHPSGLLLGAYMLLLLPLTGLGFVSVLTRAVAVPAYVTAEITATVPGAIGYTTVLIALGVVSTRLALTLPLFVVEDVSAARAMALSWRITRGRPDSLLTVACLGGLLLGAVAVVILSVIAVTPTTVSDALAPEASAWVAAASLGVAEVVAVAVGGFAVLLLASGLLELLSRVRPHPRVTPIAPLAPRRAAWRTFLASAVVITAMIVSAITLNVPVMQALASQPSTLIGVQLDAGAAAEGAHGLGVASGVDVVVVIAAVDQHDGPAAATLGQAIQSSNDPGRLIVASPDERVIHELAREYPAARTARVLDHPAFTIPSTDADLVLVPHASATSDLLAAAHTAGLAVIVTEAPSDGVHALVREGADIIVTADPAAAAREREAIAGETGLAAALIDIVFRFIVIF